MEWSIDSCVLACCQTIFIDKSQGVLTCRSSGTAFGRPLSSTVIPRRIMCGPPSMVGVKCSPGANLMTGRTLPVTEV